MAPAEGYRGGIDVTLPIAMTIAGRRHVPLGGLVPGAFAQVSEMSTISNAVDTITADRGSYVQIGNNIYGTEDRCLTDLRSTDPRDDKTRIRVRNQPTTSNRWRIQRLQLWVQLN
ncbi:hypothetical protein EDB81DRAFT_890359 [Dactylonectria macrodidyma]|uniref:Uncharacterized protein n=1 Tax=Dactylonectria macrodidyma TaxID=307937 RepID=A0A9P9DP90_9HYPO|nr:hypothetical protein EDB81DRAFT_890359 [Dactylonectria macrodidyma]